jgi:hypothetical protein
VSVSTQELLKGACGAQSGFHRAGDEWRRDRPHAEDVDATTLTYVEVKATASGNPLVIKKASVDAEVIRLSRLKQQHLDSQYQLRYRIKSFVESAEIWRRENRPDRRNENLQAVEVQASCGTCNCHLMRRL